MLFGGTQTRSLKKANYVEKIGDNERIEDVLESLEVRDDTKDTQPHLSMNEQNAKRAEEMSKGESTAPND
jgi:translation initiation factor RLI1